MGKDEEFEPAKDVKGRMNESLDKMPDGHYAGVCPGCGAEVRMSVNWGREIIRSCIVGVCVTIVLLIGYWLLR